MAENNNEGVTMPNNEQFGQNSNFNVGEKDLQALADSVKPSEQLQPLKENVLDVKSDDSQEMIDDSSMEIPEKNGLDRKMIYTMSTLIELGYQFADLEVNRAVDENAK